MVMGGDTWERGIWFGEVFDEVLKAAAGKLCGCFPMAGRYQCGA